MKKSFILASCLSLILGVGFVGCSDDDDDKDPDTVVPSDDDKKEDEDNGGNGGLQENKEISSFLKSLKKFSTKTDVELFDKYLAAIPAGIYEFNDQHVFVKCKDGGAYIVDTYGMEQTSNLVGNSIYNMSYGYDGKLSGYMFYNDYNEKTRPAFHKYEHISKSELTSNGIAQGEFLHKFYTYLERTFCFYMIDDGAYLGDEYSLHSEDAELQGIPCKHYYINSSSGSVEIVMGNSLKNETRIADFYVTKEGFILQYTNPNANWVELTGYTPFDGDFESAYETITSKYNAAGRYKMNDCVKSYKKYVDEWPTALVPAGAREYLVKYNGKISSYDVSYRAFDQYNGFVSLEIVADKSATIEDFRKYVADVKGTGLCTIHDEADLMGMLSLEISNSGCTDPELGQTLYYPAYEIDYSTIGDDFNLNNRRIVFTINSVTGV